MSLLNLFLSLLVALTAIQTIHAVEYSITNKVPSTAGGVRYTNEIGDAYSMQTLTSASDFIWRVFQQNSVAERKNVPRVSLFIDSFDSYPAYATSNHEIYLSANYMANYGGHLKTEITGVLYHEMTHIWQWNGNGQAPGWLTEGIADFVRLKAGYVPSHWVQPGGGNRWDDGYDKTARFLDYCNGLRNGFVAELNKKMASGYSDNYFVELLGKTVDVLWSEYKAKYN